MEFVMDSVGTAASDLLEKHTQKVTDPAYPRCWLLWPPKPMRLVQLVGTVWNALTSQRREAGLPPLLETNKLMIMEDLIISNVLYNGLGSAENISRVSRPAAESLLTAVVQANSSGAGGLQPASFLMCNTTAREWLGSQLLPFTSSEIVPNAFVKEPWEPDALPWLLVQMA
jgi:hypothetical protein